MSGIAREDGNAVQLSLGVEETSSKPALIVGVRSLYRCTLLGGFLMCAPISGEFKQDFWVLNEAL